jgi:hypothetical protein
MFALIVAEQLVMKRTIKRLKINMSQVFVLLKKVFSQVAMVPGYEVVSQPPTVLQPKTKLVTLEPGEYVEVSRCEISPDLKDLRINAYKVINDNGAVKEEFVESYFLERI